MVATTQQFEINERVQDALGTEAYPQGRMPSLTQADLQALVNMPELIAGVDLIDFQQSVTTAGVATNGSAVGRGPYQTKLGYVSQLVAIRGYMLNPATDPDAPSYLRWNIDVPGYGHLFTSNPYFSYLLDTNGGSKPLEWPGGVRVFQPATQLQLEVFNDAAYNANNISETKLFGLMLSLNLYRIPRGYGGR